MTTEQTMPGHLFVLIGPGGAGKNTLIDIVTDELPNLRKLVTATTRDQRAGEVDGTHYHFLTPTEFKAMIVNGDLLEYQEVTRGKYYGIPRASVENSLGAGLDLVGDIEVKGARVLRQTYPQNVTLIFITVPGENEAAVIETLRQRMIARDDNPDVIAQRLERARNLELPFQSECSYTIVNDDRQSAAEALKQIIVSWRQQHHAFEEVSS